MTYSGFRILNNSYLHELFMRHMLILQTGMLKLAGFMLHALPLSLPFGSIFFSCINL